MIRCEENGSEVAQDYAQPQGSNVSLESLFMSIDAWRPYKVTKPLGVVIGLYPTVWLTALAINQEIAGQMQSMKKTDVKTFPGSASHHLCDLSQVS